MIAVQRRIPTFLSLKRNVNFVNVSTTPVPLHFSSTRPTTIYDVLKNKYDFPHELASRVASELTRLKDPEKADSILSLFKATGFSNAQLQKILRYMPELLCASLENTIRPKIMIFQDEGFSSGDISKIISSDTRILYSSLNNNIIPSLSVMKGLLGSNNDVIKVIRLCPRLMTANLEKNVVPNVEFLKSCGVPMDRVRVILNAFPRALLHTPQVMSRSADKAKEMGLNPTSKAFIYAIATIASMSNEAWELKLQAFRDMGFSDSNILTMFRKAPLVFCASMAKIKKITEALVSTGKFNISSIVDYPSALRYSMEMRYTPRLRIFGILESRNLIESWPPLPTLCHSSDAEFFERFVGPYLDHVGDVYFPKCCAKGKHEMKP